MTEKRLLALIALLVGLIGGLLILADALDAVRRTPTLESVIGVLASGILGVAILLASLLIYRGKSVSGGVLNILFGVVAFVLERASTTGAILAIVSGVIGLIASETRA